MNAQLVKPTRFYRFDRLIFTGRISTESVKSLSAVFRKVRAGRLDVSAFFEVCRAFGLERAN
jgi:hypothetical protein